MDEFVKAMERADKAMQDAMRYVPGERDLACQVVVRTFREVRATLVMAHELQREAHD